MNWSFQLEEMFPKCNQQNNQQENRNAEMQRMSQSAAIRNPQSGMFH